MLRECRLQQGNEVLGSTAGHVLPSGESEFEHLVSISGQSWNQKLDKTPSV